MGRKGAPNPYSDYNKPNGNIDGRSAVNKVGGNRGFWYENRPAYVAAHEAGHLFGLFDLYYPDPVTGYSRPYATWEKSIMANSKQNVDQRTIDLLMDLNGIEECTCGN